MISTKINRYCSIGLFILLTILCSCQSDEEKALSRALSSVENFVENVPQDLSQAVINEYKNAELAINRRYIYETKEIIFNDFEEKLNLFEDKEFGFWQSYKYMFKVLIEDEEEWNDYWNLKKLKYFSSITTRQKLHDCYECYTADIQRLRGQISKSPKCKAIPEEVIFNIPPQEVSLLTMNRHSYTNFAIEFGTDIAVWLCITGLVAIISLVIGCAAPPAWILTVISIISSIVLSICNDNNMINSLREQYKNEIEFDNSNVLEQLDESTNLFYDYLSK